MQTLNENELHDIHGGILPLLVLAGAALLLSSCESNKQTSTNQPGSSSVNVNCSDCSVTITVEKGNNSK